MRVINWAPFMLLALMGLFPMCGEPLIVRVVMVIFVSALFYLLKIRESEK